ncbi:MAG: ABC-2 transporter permease, partial [Oscillospiraceae bacterium]|nr:ABC-2 transporter permease [Oscillospiraceae bacterium]
MFGLVFKQLKLQKAYLIIFAVGILSIGGISVFCSLLGKTGAEVDMVSVVLPLFLLLYICDDAVSSNFFVPDENKKWAAFIISTPLGARGQVKVQYILTILIMYVTNISC